MVEVHGYNLSRERSLEALVQISRLAKLGNEVVYRTTAGKTAASLEKFRQLASNFVKTKQSSELLVLTNALRKKMAQPKQCARAIQICLEQDLLVVLLDMLEEADFESRKEIVNVFVALMGFRGAGKQGAQCLDTYLADKGCSILSIALKYIAIDELALHGGTVFRGCLLHRGMDNAIVDNFAVILKCFEPNLTSKSFDIVSDAFLSFSKLLMALRSMSPQLVSDSYDMLCPYMHRLLKSTEYVTQRQALTLLRSVLFDRVNYCFMQRFIQERDNLVIVMKLLANPSVTIRWGAYHIFKVFAANPRKPEKIQKVLLKNRTKLISYLEQYITFTDLKLELELRTVIRNLESIGEATA